MHRLLIVLLPVALLATLALSAAPSPAVDGHVSPDCSALLPDAEVVRVCRVPGAAGDAAGDSDDGCSRTYLHPDTPEASLMFTVLSTRSEMEASAMVQIEALTALAGGGRSLDDMGDGGVARTISAPTGGPLGYVEHAVTFSVGSTVVTLKAPQVHADRPVMCSLDQLAVLARGVADRLP